MSRYLKKAFEELGKTQKEVIKDLGKSQPYVSALMNGKKPVGKEVAERLHKLYGFDIGKMLAGDIEEKFIGDGTYCPEELETKERKVYGVKCKECEGLRAQVKQLEDRLIDKEKLIRSYEMQLGLNDFKKTAN